MDRFATYFPWVVTLLLIAYIGFISIQFHDQGMDWEQKCKQDNGYPTNQAYMDWHSKWHRLCINPRSVVEVD